MTAESTTPRSRRAVLMGAMGGVVAFAAAALHKPAAVYAGSDGDVVLNGNNTTTLSTRIENSSNANDVLQVFSGTGIALYANSTTGYAVFGSGQGVQTAQFENLSTGAGVYGHAADGIGLRGAATGGKGVQGESTSNVGVYGSTGTGWGVVGTSPTSGIGVYAETHATDKPASIGLSLGHSTGVQGYSGVNGTPAAKAKTGVFGEADQDTSSRGVWGQSAAGQGVRGQTTTGRGVNGVATSGIGLWGEATTGYALQTSGRVKLDKSAGQASIASGTSSVVVNPGIDLTSTSAVVATLNGNAGASTAVKRVAIDTTANTFTIYLTANANATVKVAWIVLG
jgi:hypothetical protein